MSREDLTPKEHSVQIAIFRAFSSKQRLQLWLDKMDEVVKLDWSAEEKAHIMSMRTMLKEEWFSDDFRNDSIKFKTVILFEKGWILEGVEKFSWTPKLIAGMVGKVEKLVDKQGNLEAVNKISISPSVASPRDCGCNVAWNMCGGPFGYSTCMGGGCTTSPWGCGMFFGYYCDGICSTM